MEYYNNILCVTCEELTSGDNPVMKYITLYQNVRRGNIESINRAGGFSAMSQDQGTKLEGMFTSGLNHWVSIDEKTEDVAGRMASAEGHLAKIAENTGKSAGFLGEIKEDIKRIIRDGLRMKSS